MKAIILSIIILITCNFTSYADIEVKQENWNEYIKTHYKIERKISQYKIDANMITIKKIASHEIFKDLDITIIMNTHSVKGANAIASPVKINDRYHIIFCNRYTYSAERTIIHELGHVFQYEYINLNVYNKFVYKHDILSGKGWYNNLREDFAEDFKYYFTDGRLNKRTNRAYNWRATWFFNRLLRR